MADENERRRLVSSFTEILAVTEEQATAYLERYSWNFEAAVQNYVSNQENGEMDASSSADTSSDLEPVPLVPDRRSSVRPYSGNLLLRMLWLIVMIPCRYIIYVIRDALSFIYGTFMLPFQSTSDPLTDVIRFSEVFESRYGSRHPVFYQGIYSSALIDAKRELRYLIIYLHSSYHEDTDRFCRDVICSEQFISFVNTNGIFWACDVSTGEGYRVSNVMRDSSYPFLALVCLRNGQMAVVFRQEGYLNAGELVTLLEEAARVNNVYLNLARDERHNNEMNQILRRQQEEAYEEALRKDRENEQRQMEAKKQKMEEQERKKEMAEKQAQEKQNLILQRQECANALPAEPEAGDAVRIRLKFPSGDTFERRFLPSDSVKLLRDYVFSRECCPRNFSIYIGYPRKLVHSSEAQLTGDAPTIGSFCRGKAEAVLIVDNDA